MEGKEGKMKKDKVTSHSKEVTTGEREREGRCVDFLRYSDIQKM
jgi:hypothetical protein